MTERGIEMYILMTTVQAVKKRPFIPILVGVLMLVAAIVNAFIPVMAIIIGIVNMTGGNIFEAILSMLQMMIEPGNIPTLLIILAVFTVLASIVAGLLLPGYLLIVDDAIAKEPKRWGLFAQGLKSYFFRFFLMTLKTVLGAAFLALFLMISSVPAIIVTRAAFSTKPDLLIAALFVDFMTVGVLFFCLTFFKTYVFMWYVAASKGVVKPFAAGKSAANMQFWNMVLNLLVFDVIFAAVIYIIYLSNSQALRYVSGWVFTTAFFTTLSVYLVQTYRDSSQKTDL